LTWDQELGDFEVKDDPGQENAAVGFGRVKGPVRPFRSDSNLIIDQHLANHGLAARRCWDGTAMERERAV
jgi:hypothetical protein